MKLSDKAQESLGKVISAFESGDLSPVTDLIKIRRATNDKFPAGSWSLANQIIAFIQAGGELDCRGFRQWEEVSRKVRKGARAVYILAPKVIKIDDEQTGEEKRIVSGFATIPVFPVHQTEGESLPTFDYAPTELPPLYDVAKRFGLTVEYGPMSGAHGWYSPSEHHIELGVHHPAVFFHELAHAAHDRIETLKGGQDAEQETVAEFTAAVLAELYGTSYTGDAWHYIKHYSSDPLTAIYKALSTVEKVLSLILDESCQNEPSSVAV